MTVPPPATPSPVTEFDLREYLRVLRARKATILLAIFVVVGTAVIASLLQTPVYSSTAKVLIQQRTTDFLFNTGNVFQPANAVKTEIEVLESESIQSAVRQKLGRAPAMSAAQRGDTDVIQVTAESTDAKTAAVVANAYATAYLDFRRSQAVNDVLEASKQIQAKIGELQIQIEQASGGQKDALVQAQALFKQKLDQLQVDSTLKTGGAQLVGNALTPTSPIKPNLKRNVALALFAALLVGVAAAFLFDYLDDSVKSKEDLTRIAVGVPVVGLIPAVSGWDGSDQARVISLEDPRSPVSEAYRTLRTSIQFLGLEHPMRTLQITSPSAQEGKSTTLANLAVALARAGQRVTIVCCDLRRPRLHEFFGLDNSVGFTSVLLGKVPLSAALQDVPAQPRLTLLASGPLPPNPSELLASSRTAEVLTSLHVDSDIVLVDSPPVLPVTDAVVLSGHVDATLLVCVATATTRKEATRAVELLQQVDAPLVGTLLNGVSTEGAYGDDYQYFRTYEQPDPARSSKRRSPKGARTAKRQRSDRSPAQNPQSAAKP